MSLKGNTTVFPLTATSLLRLTAGYSLSELTKLALLTLTLLTVVIKAPANAESVFNPGPRAVANTDSYTNIESNMVLSGDNEHIHYEQQLQLVHEDIVHRYHSTFSNPNKGKQPANQTEQCLIRADTLEGYIGKNSLIFWEGSCSKGYADGFGRIYVVNAGRKTFEMLSHFNSEDPTYSTTYYTKDTSADAQTVYFYGKSNSYQSSGITITKSNIDSELVVAMQMIDKSNLITYQKEISQNTHYVLNIKDLGNFAHLTHDLSNTVYRSLFMSYRMLDRSTNTHLGYSFTGYRDGRIVGTFTDINGNVLNNQSISADLLRHIQSINEDVDVNVETCIKNVIESLPVLQAYLNVICSSNYSNPVCTKMQCKQICDVKSTVTPDNPDVKDLLLMLVDHHNNRTINTYLAQTIENMSKQPQPGIMPDRADPALTAPDTMTAQDNRNQPLPEIPLPDQTQVPESINPIIGEGTGSNYMQQSHSIAGRAHNYNVYDMETPPSYEAKSPTLTPEDEIRRRDILDRSLNLNRDAEQPDSPPVSMGSQTSAPPKSLSGDH